MTRTNRAGSAAAADALPWCALACEPPVTFGEAELRMKEPSGGITTEASPSLAPVRPARAPLALRGVLRSRDVPVRTLEPSLDSRRGVVSRTLRVYMLTVPLHNCPARPGYNIGHVRQHRVHGVSAAGWSSARVALATPGMAPSAGCCCSCCEYGRPDWRFLAAAPSLVAAPVEQCISTSKTDVVCTWNSLPRY